MINQQILYEVADDISVDMGAAGLGADTRRNRCYLAANQ
jgi:hypothetical protein